MANVLLGVTGSVAAVRTPALFAALARAGHAVRVVATGASLYFFDPADVPLLGDQRPRRGEVANDLRVRGEQPDGVAVLSRLERDPRAAAAAEDVGQAAHAVDRGLCVARRHEDTHGESPGTG